MYQIHWPRLPKDDTKQDYAVKAKPVTARNPQANAVLERVHQVIGNNI